MARPEPIDVGIHGVLIVPLTPHPDERGFFAESYRRDWIPGMEEMVQGNLSRSRANVLRGLHFHRRQADYWTVLSGTAFVGLFDLRKGSPTEGKKAEVELAADALRCLYIPRGVAHGFYTGDGILLQYLVDRYHSGDDEFGVAWDDPGVGISWPASQPILSDRDRSNPSLAKVLPEAPPFEG
jgi:dTDP-4-dehydrorhamnose 3,5-epimerase